MRRFFILPLFLIFFQHGQGYVWGQARTLEPEQTISPLSKFSASSSLLWYYFPQSELSQQYENISQVLHDDFSMSLSDLTKPQWALGLNVLFYYHRDYLLYYALGLQVDLGLSSGFEVQGATQNEKYRQSWQLQSYQTQAMLGYYLLKSSVLYIAVEACLQLGLGELFLQELVESPHFDGQGSNKFSLHSFGAGLQTNLKFTVRLQNNNGILVSLQGGFQFYNEFFGANALKREIVLTKGQLSADSSSEVLLLTQSDQFNASTQQKVSLLQPFAGISLGFWQSL